MIILPLVPNIIAMAQASLAASRTFEDSYVKFEDYPANLLYKKAHSFTLLESYNQRLRRTEPRLFSKDSHEVQIWDYRAAADAAAGFFHRERITSDGDLKAWIGDASGDATVDTTGRAPRVGAIATKCDPPCRFVFLSGVDQRSRKPLRISRKMLSRILSYHQVMPEFLDFVSVFGQQNNSSTGLRFGGLKRQSVLLHPPQLEALRNLGRSGRQYQLCYNLQNVFLKVDADADPTDATKVLWQVKQTSVHHQFDICTGHSLWIVVKGDLEMQTRFQAEQVYLRFQNAEERFISSLHIHMMHFRWATEGWAWSLQWLEDIIQLNVRKNIGSGFDNTPMPVSLQVYELANFYETKANEAVMILKLNLNIMTCIRKFYEDLLGNDHRSDSQCAIPFDSASEDFRHAVSAFKRVIQSAVDDFETDLVRAETIALEISELKNLITQQLRSQDANEYSFKMKNLAHATLEDSTVMRIITLVTLFFLPATFVSTFFSTDVVRYQNQGNNNGANATGGHQATFMGSFSSIALERWLEVTIPLTVITFSVGYAMYFWDPRHKR